MMEHDIPVIMHIATCASKMLILKEVLPCPVTSVDLKYVIGLSDLLYATSQLAGTSDNGYPLGRGLGTHLEVSSEPCTSEV